MKKKKKKIEAVHIYSQICISKVWSLSSVMGLFFFFRKSCSDLFLTLLIVSFSLPSSSHSTSFTNTPYIGNRLIDLYPAVKPKKMTGRALLILWA